MFPRRPLCLAVVLAGSLMPAAVAADPAQLASDPFYYGCEQNPTENDRAWRDRCNREAQERAAERQRQAEAQARRSREIEELRARLAKQPPLPAAQNRLLGSWQRSARPAGSDPLSQLLGGALEVCALLVGDGLEFRPDRMAGVTVNGLADLSLVDYRAGTNGSVHVIPQRGLYRLISFEFETPNRIRLIDAKGCTMDRTASLRTGNGQARPAAATAPQPANSRPPAAAALRTLDDLIGYQCAGGSQLVVVSCFDESADARCGVLHLDRPLTNGYQARTSTSRGEVTKQVASCTQRRLVIDDKGKVAFAP